MQELEKLCGLMRRLRKECPWDREQSLMSLRKYVLEEAYEVVEAIHQTQNSTDSAHLIEELGDLLFQVVFQAEILKEITNRDSILSEIIGALNEKLIRRHPHVFSDEKVADSNEVVKNWEKIKESEKQAPSDPFGRINSEATALQRATKIGARSKKLDFDWRDASEVWGQLEMEKRELQQAKSLDEEEDELGDLLFCLCQWARHRGLDAEVALSRSNQKFMDRFRRMNEILEKEKKSFDSLTRPEKEDLWKEAKTQLRFEKS